MPPKDEAQEKREEQERLARERKEAEAQRAEERRAQEAEGDGPRYRLVSPHVIEGNTIPAGTEVGAGTPYPYEHTPSNQMAGVNPEGVRRVNEVHQRLYGKDAPWHDERLERVQREEDELAQRQREEEANAAPVSYAQAYERGHQWDGKDAVVPPHLHRPIRTPTRGGDTSQPLGPATADQDYLNNPDVAVRTTRPLQEQMPQGGGAASAGTQPTKKD